MTNSERIKKIVGKNVKKLRQEMGLTQERLAEKINASTSHIANIERGSTWISSELLSGLCNIFDKRPAEIYSDYDMSFEFSGNWSHAMTDSIKEELENSENEFSQKVLKRFTNKIISGEYSDHRRERVPLQSVASENKKHLR